MPAAAPPAPDGGGGGGGGGGGAGALRGAFRTWAGATGGGSGGAAGGGATGGGGAAGDAGGEASAAAAPPPPAADGGGGGGGGGASAHSAAAAAQQPQGLSALAETTAETLTSVYQFDPERARAAVAAAIERGDDPGDVAGCVNWLLDDGEVCVCDRSLVLTRRVQSSQQPRVSGVYGCPPILKLRTTLLLLDDGMSPTAAAPSSPRRPARTCHAGGERDGGYS